MPIASGTGIRGLAAAFDTKTFIGINRTGNDTIIGDVYIIDILAGTTELEATITHVSGSPTSDVTAQVIDPGAETDMDFMIPVVATQVGADNTEVVFLIQGVYQIATAASLDPEGNGIGDICLQVLESANSLQAADDGTTSGIVGILLEPNPGATIVRLWVMFDGLHGFGNSNVT